MTTIGFRASLLLGMLTTSFSLAAAQTPTFSLELTQVNSTAINGTGVGSMPVAPGDLLTAEIWLRDWSPARELATAYQAELNDASYNSGSSGTIRPIGYSSSTLKGIDNPQNAFIDNKHPRWLHANRHTLSYADSKFVQPGYRWLSVLFGNVGPISQQDGTKFYLGTLRLVVSEDAAGTFTLAFTPGKDETGLLQYTGEPILPVETEALTLVIEPSPNRCWMERSNPPYASIDARSASGSKVKAWDRVELTFSSDRPDVSAASFTVEDGSATPPRITKVNIEGRIVTLAFDRPVSHNAWTAITHTKSGTRTCLGRLHGDVNQDGVTDARDLALLVAPAVAGKSLPLTQGDVDGNGRLDAMDALNLLTLVADPTPVRLPWFAR